MKYLLFTLLLLSPEAWTVDSAASKVSFSVKGPFGTVHGTLSGLEATVQFSDKDLGSSTMKARIPVKTISTGTGKRDRDLCNEEVWFNVAKYPDITFVSHKFTKTADGYSVEGDLTIKGVAKPATIPFTFVANGAGGVFKGNFIVHRTAYGLGKSGGMVGDEVTISLEVPVKK
jgi:polyisoprenoid-binding protein YceI